MGKGGSASAWSWRGCLGLVVVLLAGLVLLVVGVPWLVRALHALWG